MPAQPAHSIRVLDKFAVGDLARRAPAHLLSREQRLVLHTLLAAMSSDGSMHPRYKPPSRDALAEMCGYQPSTHRPVNEALSYLVAVGVLRLVSNGGGRGNVALYETRMPLNGPLGEWLRSQSVLYRRFLKKSVSDDAVSGDEQTAAPDPAEASAEDVAAPLSSANAFNSLSSSPSTGGTGHIGNEYTRSRGRGRRWSDEEQQRSDLLLNDIGRHLCNDQRQLLNEHLVTFQAEIPLRKLLLRIESAGLWNTAMRVVTEPADHLNGRFVAYGNSTINAVAVLYARLDRFRRTHENLLLVTDNSANSQAVQQALATLGERLGTLDAAQTASSSSP